MPSWVFCLLLYDNIFVSITIESDRRVTVHRTASRQYRGIPPIDVRPRVVDVEGATQLRFGDQFRVVHQLPEALDAIHFAVVCAQHALTPRLGVRDVARQPLLSLVQKIDYIIVVIASVVVQVFVLQEFGPANGNRFNYYQRHIIIEEVRWTHYCYASPIIRV